MKYFISFLFFLFTFNTFAESYKVGITLPLSGDFAEIGQQFTKGIKSQAKKHPDFQFIIEDAHFLENHKTLASIKKLIYTDKVSLLILTTFDEIALAKNIALKNDVPVVSLWDSLLSFKEEKNLFSTGLPLEAEAKLLAEYLKHKNINTIAVLSQNFYWSETLKELFIQEIKKSNIKIVFQEAFNLDNTDFKPTILKLKRLNPDYIFYVFTPYIDLFYKQLKNYNYNPDLITPGAFVFDYVTNLPLQYFQRTVFSGMNIFKDKKISEITEAFQIVGAHGIEKIFQNLEIKNNQIMILPSLGEVKNQIKPVMLKISSQSNSVLLQELR